MGPRDRTGHRTDTVLSMSNQHTTEQIIARARQEMAARQQVELGRHWGDRWQVLLPGLVLAVLLAFLAAPLPVPRKLLLAMGGVCGLRLAHSYFAGDIQLPLESRMVGIYGGFTLMLIVLLLLRRFGARRLGSRLTIALLASFFASMVVDGINSTLTELGVPHRYQSTNVTRLVTGLLSGIALAPFLIWLLGVVATPPEQDRSRVMLGSPWELLLPLSVSAGFAALVVREQALLYYPIALASVGGVVLSSAMAALLIVLHISGMSGRVARVRQLVAPGALALLLAVAVLAVAATVRWSLTGA